MNEGQNGHHRAQARQSLQVREAQESAARREARERVRAAQERERQERQQRASTSRRRSEDTAMAPRRGPAHSTTMHSDAPARHAAPIDTVEESTMSVSDVIELFNHPLGEEEMRLARQALAADAAWSCLMDEDHADRLTCTLVHQASGIRVHVAQERSLVGIWNSCI